MNEESFKLIKGFKSYVSKPEITDIGANFLVRGSKNVLIDYASRIISRNGYSLYRQANNGGGPIRSAYDWKTSSAKSFSLRVYDGRVEFDWNSTYNLLKSGFATSTMEFAKVWDNTEKIDILLFVIGDTNMYKWSGGVAKIRSSTATTVTKQGVLTAVSSIAFVAGTPGTVAATITDSSSNFVNAGFIAGDTLYVTGSSANSRNFTVASVTAGTITLVMGDTLTSEAAGPAITLHNGEPTWASARFLTTGTRKINYLGTDYTYTGGETTDTLTGLTAFPTATLGDPTWQTLITLANPSPIATYKADFIAIQLNQVILASLKSQDIYVSSTTDYTNFTLTSPRAPGDPAKVNMDNYCTCIVPIDNLDQTVSNLMFGGGESEFFKFDYKLTQDNGGELIRMLKLKTAVSAGVISRGAITPIKNSTAYISREPTLDTLGNIQNLDGQKNVPLSDLVKNDFDIYDFTNCHIIYWRRAIYIALPAMGLVLIYDLQRSLWQPPQTLPVARFSIIGDWLYGHSSITNETYKLFTGTNDNGVLIPQVVRFSYNNGGRRDRIKNMSEYWTDGYITASGVLSYKVYFNFEGKDGVKNFSISGADTNITSQVQGSGLGDAPLGINPLGGATLNPIPGLPGTNTPLLRFWQLDTMQSPDYVEHFVEYQMNVLDGQFALVAHGSNQWDASSVPIRHKK